MNPKELAALVLLAALWGASFLFVRVAAPVLGPFVTIEGRVLIAGIALACFALFTGKGLNLKVYARPLFIMGLLNSAIPFSLMAFAQLTLSASFASILNATTPLFTAIVAAIYLKERFNLKRIMGLALGLVGVSILVGWNPLGFTSTSVLAILAMLGTALFYGISGVYAKKALKGVPALSAATGQMFNASGILLIPALLSTPQKPVSGLIIACVLGLALLCSALAYLLYFFLIEQVGPTKTLTVTYLIPIFGSLWGIVFLKETLSLTMLVGLAVILVSVVFVNEVKFAD